jgi:hypothetical protein
MCRVFGSSAVTVLLLSFAACAGRYDPMGSANEADGGTAMGDARAADSQGDDARSQSADAGSTPTSCAEAPFVWKIGAWSVCNTSCGDGQQIRPVECRRCDDNQIVGAAHCGGAPPEKRRACKVDTGCGFSWQTGAWSSCSTRCGDGTQSRSVDCQRADGAMAPDANCSDAKPDASRHCNDLSGCSFNYTSWSVWGVCVRGQKERVRRCQRADGQTASCSECGGNCHETQTCCAGANIVSGMGRANCESIIANVRATCRSTPGCTWAGPDVCTIGGSPSSATSYGAVVRCY